VGNIELVPTSKTPHPQAHASQRAGAAMMAKSAIRLVNARERAGIDLTLIVFFI
jgi:hypothetical protein